MEIRDLIYVATATHAGNLAGAARSLGVETSTVSRRIARLEDELGLAIFERGHAGIRLTSGGRAIMAHVKRALAELDAIKVSGVSRGSGDVGEVRLGVRMPPVGEPISSLLYHWHQTQPGVVLTVSEMSDQEMVIALEERRLDAVFMTSHTLWPRATAVPLYRERLVAALPDRHRLSDRDGVDWAVLREETLLVQGWDESQAARELYASFLGSGTSFQAHAASKQSIFALVAADFGITLATMSQSEIAFPGITFKPIDEPDAWVEVSLAWLPELEDATVGRFVTYMRDEARSRHLL
jgi:DNA-binding transcriptional LysR family regulator